MFKSEWSSHVLCWGPKGPSERVGASSGPEARWLTWSFKKRQAPVKLITNPVWLNSEAGKRNVNGS